MNDRTKALPTSYHQGYCYFDVTTGKFWIDTSNAAAGRMAINAYKADVDNNGNVFSSTYANKLVSDSTNHTLTLQGYDSNDLSSGTVTLGALAFYNNAEGSSSGVTITPTTDNVLKLKQNGTNGTVPSLSTSVANEALTFNFNEGTMTTIPTYNEVAAWIGYSSAVAAAQTFNGVEGDAANGDNIRF